MGMTIKEETNDLGVENDLVSSIVEKISEKATETREEFIFETIRPYCENVVQMKISKRELEQALLKYYGKNDLGVDCIDRQAAITFVCKNTEEILKDTMPLEVKLSDDYLYENVAKIMRNPKVLPAVTPQEPRKGHWIGQKKIGFGEWKECIVPLKDGRVTDSCSCSECGDWLTGSDEYACNGNFCPNCGADMREEKE